jgi:hypothetical protein
MTRLELVERGEESIADANFLRRRLIPVAYRENRWNIVVFECFRAVELLVKGIACLSGYAPRETHEIDSVVDGIVKNLKRTRTAAPLFVSLETTTKNRYGVSLTSKTLSLLMDVAGEWTALAETTHRLPADQLVRIALTWRHFAVTVSVDGKTLLVTSDATLVPRFLMHRSFMRAPRATSIGALKALSRSLLSTRESAFFTTRRFTQRDARSAIAKMNLALGATKSFYVEKQ